MKKLLKTLALLLALTAAGCVSAPSAPTGLTATAKERPAIVQYFDDNEKVRVVDYKDDNLTLWMWVDKFDIPGDCDYVVVLGYMGGMDQRSGLPAARVLTVFNRDSGPDPCALATYEYERYLEELRKEIPDA